MAKILYGVAGEGMGHAVRSKVLIEHLQKKHKVKVVSAHRSFKYLSKFSDAEKIGYFKIIYRNNKAANLLTLLNNLLRFPIIFYKGLKVGRIIKKFKPEIILTDFEPITNYYATIKKIPCVSVDNQHLITSADHSQITKQYRLTSFLTKFIIDTFILRVDKMFILSFLPAQGIGEDVNIIKPLLRKEILRMKPKDKNHILVYQTSTSNKDLVRELSKVNQKFIVYGFHKNKKTKNVILKKNNEKDFFKDLRDCKAVITNGGFSLITEALYLKKPVLSIPVEKQFEQIINAIHLDMSGYGMFSKKTSEKDIEDFIHLIPEYKKNLQKYGRYNNAEAFKLIDKTISKLVKNRKE